MMPFIQLANAWLKIAMTLKNSILKQLIEKKSNKVLSILKPKTNKDRKIQLSIRLFLKKNSVKVKSILILDKNFRLQIKMFNQEKSLFNRKENNSRRSRCLNKKDRDSMDRKHMKSTLSLHLLVRSLVKSLQTPNNFRNFIN